VDGQTRKSSRLCCPPEWYALEMRVDFEILYEGGTYVGWYNTKANATPKIEEIFTIQIDRKPRNLKVLCVWPAFLVGNTPRMKIDCRVV